MIKGLLFLLECHQRSRALGLTLVKEEFVWQAGGFEFSPPEAFPSGSHSRPLLPLIRSRGLLALGSLFRDAWHKLEQL